MKNRIIALCALVAIFLISCKKEIATEPVVDKSLNPIYVSVTVGTQTSFTVRVK